MDKKSTADAPEVRAACHHMKHNVQALAEGALKGPLRWYTQMHCSYCNQCGTSLQTLRTAEEALFAINE